MNTDQPKKFNLSLYNDEFFRWHTVHGDYYGVATGLNVFNHYKPSSVADLGCGIGSYLWAAMQAKVPMIQGWEIATDDAKRYTRPELLPHIKHGFDITAPMDFGDQKYDIVFCVEVGEHIEPSGSEQLVDNVCRATGKLLLFTAAPPGQDGCGHINTHPLDYWRGLFARHEFVESSETPNVRLLLDPPHPAIHSPKWVMDNLLVMCPV